jgi:anti-sigma factor RsiW
MTPYVDGALPADERATLDRHLDGCGPCRRAVEEAGGGRHVLRGARARLEHPPLPPGLRTRCEALARHHGSRRSATGWAGRLAPGAAIAVLIFATALVVFAMATRRSNVLLAQQLTVDHLKCFRIFAPADGHGMDAHLVREMLATRYGWDVHVPPSSAADGITLVGARRCLYASGTIPHVMYRVGGEEMSLFVLDGEQRPPADLDTLGHRSKIWSDGENTFVLVSPRGAGALNEAAQYMMDQEKSR